MLSDCPLLVYLLLSVDLFHSVFPLRLAHLFQLMCLLLSVHLLQQAFLLWLVLCQEKVQIKYNQFSLCLAKLNLLFLSHFLLDFSDILPHIGLGINTRNGCEYVLYCKMFLCIQKSTYMHVYN